MVNYRQAALDSTFAALADPTRRAILARLAIAETNVTALAAPFAMSLPAVSKHLRILESAGLLRRTVAGRVHRCRLAAQPMRDATAWMEQYRVFWESQLDALEKFLVADTAKEKIACPKPRKSQLSRSKSGAPSRPAESASSPPGPTRKN
jgi:DNA-binding transcriptional ArsR family regulator